ncbi:unnamed protein product, partial [Heterosigma akashiwo]
REAKEAVAQRLGGDLPLNKFQLRHPRAGFLKDALSLAHYNLGNNATVEVNMRTRGGRR